MYSDKEAGIAATRDGVPQLYLDDKLDGPSQWEAFRRQIHAYQIDEWKAGRVPTNRIKISRKMAEHIWPNPYLNPPLGG